MVEKTYKHLHLRGLGKESSEFRAPGGGSERRLLKIDDRPTHARRLRRDLDLASSDLVKFESEQEQAGIPPKLRGMPITIEGRPDTGLEVGEARSTTRGMSLLMVKRGFIHHPENEGVRDQATFFVTSSAFETLRSNLSKYARWSEPSRQRRPNHFWLFESGMTIRSTSLRDFWGEDAARFPTERKRKYEWEIWTRCGSEEVFNRELAKLQLETVGSSSRFVETTIYNVVATSEEVQRLIRATAAIVELRSASSFVSEYMALGPYDRSLIIGEVAARIEAAGKEAPRVTILDTGVYRGHPLLDAFLPSKRCHSVGSRWKVSDHDGHGTRMAGLALFGDLSTVVDKSGKIDLAASLESVVVTAPKGAAPVPARDAVLHAVELVEKERGKRIFCLAQTARGEAETGHPTSTSAVIDQLAFNNGEDTRLFCVAVGNVPHSAAEPYQLADYNDRNKRFGIQPPPRRHSTLCQ